jgi:fatty acid-binding protein DegV
MLALVLSEVKGKTNVHAGVIHAGAEAEALRLADIIRAEVNPQELLINELTPVIGANVGPGILGMGYYTEA